MSFEGLFIGLICIVIYFTSIFYLCARIDTKEIEINLLIILILVCPILNTICTLYLVHKDSDYKKSIKKLFND